MDLVVDANILFSILIKASKTEDVIFRQDLHLYAPEFLLEEFEKYKVYLTNKTGRTPQEFDRMVAILRKRILTIPNEDTAQCLEDAKSISPDIKDSEYMASAMKLRCAVWSNDKPLKQQHRVMVYSTEDLLRLFNIA